MKAKVGLWIDHRQAMIVALTERGEETRRIESNVEKQLRRSGRSPADAPFEAQMVPADDAREREYQGHLAHYYDEIAGYLREANAIAILILGPGEAKGELKKRLDKDKGGTRIVALETADKMTEPQVAAKVRHHFLKPVHARRT
jgi:hypothetical protein